MAKKENDLINIFTHLKLNEQNQKLFKNKADILSMIGDTQFMNNQLQKMNINFDAKTIEKHMVNLLADYKIYQEKNQSKQIIKPLKKRIKKSFLLTNQRKFSIRKDEIKPFKGLNSSESREISLLNFQSCMTDRHKPLINLKKCFIEKTPVNNKLTIKMSNDKNLCQINSARYLIDKIIPNKIESFEKENRLHEIHSKTVEKLNNQVKSKEKELKNKDRLNNSMKVTLLKIKSNKVFLTREYVKSFAINENIKLTPVNRLKSTDAQFDVDIDVKKEENLNPEIKIEEGVEPKLPLLNKLQANYLKYSDLTKNQFSSKVLQQKQSFSKINSLCDLNKKDLRIFNELSRISTKIESKCNNQKEKELNCNATYENLKSPSSCLSNTTSKKVKVRPINIKKIIFEKCDLDAALSEKILRDNIETNNSNIDFIKNIIRNLEGKELNFEKWMAKEAEDDFKKQGLLFKLN